MARSVLSTGLQAKFDRLSGLSAREQAGLAQQTADDFGYRASDASFRHSTYRRSTGNQIVEALLKEAEPAVAAIAKPGEQTKMRIPSASRSEPVRVDGRARPKPDRLRQSQSSAWPQMNVEVIAVMSDCV
jgi:hypothetical protein